MELGTKQAKWNIQCFSIKDQPMWKAIKVDKCVSKKQIYSNEYFHYYIGCTYKSHINALFCMADLTATLLTIN